MAVGTAVRVASALASLGDMISCLSDVGCGEMAAENTIDGMRARKGKIVYVVMARMLPERVLLIYRVYFRGMATIVFVCRYKMVHKEVDKLIKQEQVACSHWSCVKNESRLCS